MGPLNRKSPVQRYPPKNMKQMIPKPLMPIKTIHIPTFEERIRADSQLLLQTDTLPVVTKLQDEQFREYLGKARNLICTAVVLQQKSKDLKMEVENRQMKLVMYESYLNNLLFVNQEKQSDIRKEQINKSIVTNTDEQQLQNFVLHLKNRLHFLYNQIYKSYFTIDNHICSKSILLVGESDHKEKSNIQRAQLVEKWLTDATPSDEQVYQKIVEETDPVEYQGYVELVQQIGGRIGSEQSRIKINQDYAFLECQIQNINENNSFPEQQLKKFRTGTAEEHPVFVQKFVSNNILKMCKKYLNWPFNDKNLETVAICIRETIENYARQNLFKLEKCNDLYIELQQMRNQMQQKLEADELLQKQIQSQVLDELNSQICNIQNTISKIKKENYQCKTDISLMNSDQLKNQANTELIRFSDQQGYQHKFVYDDYIIKVETLSSVANQHLNTNGSGSSLKSTVELVNRKIDILKDNLTYLQQNEQQLMQKSRLQNSMQQASIQQIKNAAIQNELHKQKCEDIENRTRIIQIDQDKASRATLKIKPCLSPIKKQTKQKVIFNNNLKKLDVVEKGFYDD